jgi:sec-independent protein translocase protein TatB
MLSIPHMIVVFIVVLVVFGPQKLPELARGLGKLMAEFRKASTDFKTAFEEEMRDLERQALLAQHRKAAEATVASATAEPNQPATLATPAGVETPPTEPPPDNRATEAPVLSPAAEAVPRAPGDPAELKTESAAAAEQQSAPHDTQQPA